jgi:hypothetical protein
VAAGPEPGAPGDGRPHGGRIRLRALETESGEQGAAEVLLQTAAFGFTNRFNDGLRLPPEDEAVRTYGETYGSDFQ